ncbi:unnamed protein product [Gemmata massiliana]|uniref:Uncharacterized protein n=1 Tax=Gemmata massiliana TaxID=1210884 RepID=A0A6P2CWK1_9BACT|nr:unnamed protein product [Gemmata massiliana]
MSSLTRVRVVARWREGRASHEEVLALRRFLPDVRDRPLVEVLREVQAVPDWVLAVCHPLEARRVCELAQRAGLIAIVEDIPVDGLGPVFNEQLARHLNLTALSVGSGRQGAVGEPGASCVLAWWTVSVLPSFHPAWVVGAVHEEERRSGLSLDRVTTRGFIADENGADIAVLETDEVSDTFGTLNLFQVTPEYMAALDGLGYRFQWSNWATEGTFRFSNPRGDWLVELERVLFRFARQIASTAKSDRFADQLRCWGGYREAITEE